ncbi:RNA-directed DNA polymerase, eukaryota, reverse transcriptase zinc-binding domain protein [Tanacetum coccineum]
MREVKRIVKPNRIFDNSDNITSKNKNKQKSVPKKKENFRNASDIMTDLEGESATEYVTEKDGTVIEVVDGIEAEMCSQYKETKSKGVVLNENDNNEGNTYGTRVEKNSNRNMQGNNDKKTYATMVSKDVKVVNNKLEFVPTVCSEEGDEFVIFDDKLVEKGSIQWKLTVCGHFVGYKMSVHELRYNIRRMWSRWGIDDIDMKSDGTCMFKFKNEEGMNKVLELGPWLVNNKPLFVQKWDPTLGLNKVEQTKVPLWVSMIDVPLEAWSTEGISALASSLGKPLIMDNMTAKRCQYGEGRLDFARVLVEFDVAKGCKDKIEIQYRDKDNKVKGSKQVKVEYAWKPDSCRHCNVFGHCYEECSKRERSTEEIEKAKRVEDDKRKNQAERNQYGRNEGGYKKPADWKMNKGKRTNHVGGKMYEAKRNNEEVWKRKENNKQDNNSQKKKQQWNEGTSQSFDGLHTGNQYDVLEKLIEEDEELEILKGRIIVDKFIAKDIIPNGIEVKTWTNDMVKYFKDQKEKMRKEEEEKDDLEDVLVRNHDIVSELNAEEVRGMDTTILN